MTDTASSNLITFAEATLDDVRSVREDVFMVEQGFSEEFDQVDDDPATVHIAARDGQRVVGCVRMFCEGSDPAEWTLGRLAVRKELRGSGLGARLVEQGEMAARQRGARSVKLHAQCRATPFYEKQGYQSYGPIEMDEHVEHIWMRKDLA